MAEVALNGVGIALIDELGRPFLRTVRCFMDNSFGNILVGTAGGDVGKAACPVYRRVSHPVMSKKPKSGCLAVVITEESAESLPASHRSHWVADHLVWCDDPIAEPLMIAFKVVMRTEMLN